MNKHRYSLSIRHSAYLYGVGCQATAVDYFYMIFIMTGQKRVGDSIRMEHERFRKGFNIRLANIETDDYN